MHKFLLLFFLIASPLMAQLNPAPYSTGSITTNASNCNTTNACIILHMATSNVGYSVTVSGTWTGTLTIEQSGDNQGSWTSVTTTTSNTLYTSALTPGITDARVRGSAAMTGTAVITITASGPATLQNVTQSGGAVPTVTSNPATCSTGQTFFNTVTGQLLLCISTNTISTASGWPASFGIADPVLYGAKADTQWVTDATWNNGSGNVSSASGRFVASDTGKQCTGIDGGTGQATLPVGTFTFLTSTTGTCSVNATVNKTNGTFVWGTNDQAAMDSAYSQLITKTPCGGTFEIPAGVIWMTANPQKAATPLTCGQFDTTLPHIKILGQGHGSSTLFFAPNFNVSNTAGGCTLAANLSCFFGGDYTDYEDFAITGLGFKNFTIATANTYILRCGNACSAKYINVTQLGAGVTNLKGIGILSQSDNCLGCYVDNAASIGISIASNATPAVTIAAFTNTGYECLVGATCIDYGSTLNGNIFSNVHGVNVVGGTMLAHGTQAQQNTTFCALAISSNGIVHSMGSTWTNANAGGGAACFTANGGVLDLSESTISNSNIALTSQAHTGNVVNDNGGNTVTGPVTAYLGTWNFRNSSGIPAALANCTSSAAPAVCASAPSGSVVVAAAATTVTVNTTSVTANSQILLTRDDSLGTKLGVTCNTATAAGDIKASTRTAGTSFVITVQNAPATNPLCLSYTILN